MDTRVLKEPRGFLRIIEWFFAIVAFATCAHFSVTSSYTVFCANNVTTPVNYTFAYPFQLDHSSGVEVSCTFQDKTDTISNYPPGDFSSDAQFFVFTGVITFLLTMATLVFYVFFSSLYLDEQKMFPTYDFILTVIIAVFWLSASAAWANAVLSMRYLSQPENWIFQNSHLNNSICSKSSSGAQLFPSVNHCKIEDVGSFKEANVSIIIGFLNFFLWTANLWFLYKETPWFSQRGGQPQGGAQLPS